MDTNISEPFVSVIMPVYNCGNYIAESLESILNQSLADFEFIIIDDCSTDNTIAVINRYHDQRIRLIIKEKNSGYVDSLNTGIEMAKGKFLARMDGDDISVITRLEKQVKFLDDHPEIALCGAWYQLLSSTEVIQHPVENEEIKIALLDYCALGHPTVMFRKGFIDEHNLHYESGFRPAEDYDLWTRISAVGKMANIPEILLYYRSHNDQVSIKEKGKQLSNSLLCRTRMLCYPLIEVSNNDLRLSALVPENEKIVEPGLLEEVIDWLEKVKKANISSCFYELRLFSAYIDQKKAAFIRSYYLNTTSYNPGVLIRFLKAKRGFNRYFSMIEQIKLVLKCLVFWKTNLMN